MPARIDVMQALPATASPRCRTGSSRTRHDLRRGCLGRFRAAPALPRRCSGEVGGDGPRPPDHRARGSPSPFRHGWRPCPVARSRVMRPFTFMRRTCRRRGPWASRSSAPGPSTSRSRPGTCAAPAAPPLRSTRVATSPVAPRRQGAACTSALAFGRASVRLARPDPGRCCPARGGRHARAASCERLGSPQGRVDHGPQHRHGHGGQLGVKRLSAWHVPRRRRAAPPRRAGAQGRRAVSTLLRRPAGSPPGRNRAERGGGGRRAAGGGRRAAGGGENGRAPGYLISLMHPSPGFTRRNAGTGPARCRDRAGAGPRRRAAVSRPAPGRASPPAPPA